MLYSARHVPLLDMNILKLAFDIFSLSGNSEKNSRVWISNKKIAVRLSISICILDYLKLGRWQINQVSSYVFILLFFPYLLIFLFWIEKSTSMILMSVACKDKVFMKLWCSIILLPINISSMHIRRIMLKSIFEYFQVKVFKLNYFSNDISPIRYHWYHMDWMEGQGDRLIGGEYVMYIDIAFNVFIVKNQT